MTGVLLRRRDQDMDAHEEESLQGPREEMASTPRRGLGTTGPGRMGSRPSRLQAWEGQTSLFRLLCWAVPDGRPTTPSEKTRRQERAEAPERGSEGKQIRSKRKKGAHMSMLQAPEMREHPGNTASRAPCLARAAGLPLSAKDGNRGRGRRERPAWGAGHSPDSEARTCWTRKGALQDVCSQQP